MNSVTLETLAEKLDLALASLSTIEGRMTSVQTPEHPQQLPKNDPWTEALAQTEEPAGLDVPLAGFERRGAILRARWRRSVLNGTQTGNPGTHALRLALVRSIYEAESVEEMDPRARAYYQACMRTQPTPVETDVMLYAVLAGHVDPFDAGFTARLDESVSQLAGTWKPDGWHPRDLQWIYESEFPHQGGGPGLGGA